MSCYFCVRVLGDTSRRKIRNFGRPTTSRSTICNICAVLHVLVLCQETLWKSLWGEVRCHGTLYSCCCVCCVSKFAMWRSQDTDEWTFSTWLCSMCVWDPPSIGMIYCWLLLPWSGGCVGSMLFGRLGYDAPPKWLRVIECVVVVHRTFRVWCPPDVHSYLLRVCWGYIGRSGYDALPMCLCCGTMYSYRR